jgi:hypothetical protein
MAEKLEGERLATRKRNNCWPDGFRPNQQLRIAEWQQYEGRT